MGGEEGCVRKCPPELGAGVGIVNDTFPAVQCGPQCVLIQAGHMTV